MNTSMNTLPDIRQIELVTGKSIIGFIVEETKDVLAVETPFQLIRSADTAEWAMFLHMCDDDHIVDINKNHIICSFPCTPHFKQQYIRMLDQLTRLEREDLVDDDDDDDYLDIHMDDTNKNTIH